MIFPEASLTEVQGLTLLQDSLHPERFYCYPRSPLIHYNLDGSPDFSVIIYRSLQSESGAHVFLGLDMWAPENMLVLAQAAAQERAPAGRVVSLSPLPLTEGEIRLMIVDSPDPTGNAAALEPGYTRIQAIPLTAEQEVVHLSANLSMEVAGLLHNILTNNPRQCGVVFRMACYGQRPSPAWMIIVDWAKLENQLQEQFTLGRICKASELAAAVDTWIENRLITIQMEAGWGDEELHKLPVVKAFLVEALSGHYFDPVYNPEANPSAETGMGPAINLARKATLAGSSIDLNASVVKRYFSGQAALPDLLSPDIPITDYLKFVDIDQESIRPVAVTVRCPQMDSLIETLTVDLEYVRPGSTEKRTVVLTPAENESTVRWLLHPGEEFTYRYTVSGRYKETAFTADSYEFALPAMKSMDQILFVHLNPALMEIRAVLRNTDQIQKADIELDYDDVANNLHYRKSITLTPGHAEETWRYLLHDEQHCEYRYQAYYHFSNGQVVEDRRTIAGDSSSLLVIPDVDSKQVRIVPLPKPDVMEYVVQLDLVSAGAPLGFTKTVQMKSEMLAHSTEVTFYFLKQDSPVNIRYQVTVIREDRSIQRGEVQETESNIIVLAPQQS